MPGRSRLAGTVLISAALQSEGLVPHRSSYFPVFSSVPAFETVSPDLTGVADILRILYKYSPVLLYHREDPVFPGPNQKASHSLIPGALSILPK